MAGGERRSAHARRAGIGATRHVASQKNFAPPFGGAGFYYWMCAARTLRGKSSIGKVQRRLQEVQRWQARTTESRFSPAHPVNPHFSLIRMDYRTDCEKFLNVTAM